MRSKPLTPLKQPVQQRSQQTVRAILEAAVQVFEQHGYAAGTTARIAERAGVSVGSLYQYFPNKGSVLMALAEQHIGEVAALAADLLQAAQSPGVPLPDMLERMVEGFLGMHAHNPGLHRLLHEGGLLPAQMQGKVRQLEQHYGAELAALLAKHPAVRRADPVLMAYFVVQSLEHFTHQLTIHPPPKAIGEAGAAELKRLLLNYLRP